MHDPPLDTFPALSSIPHLVHGFTTRIPGIDTFTDRSTALARLDQSHAALLAEHGLDHAHMARCRQVHGADVVEITRAWHPSPEPVAEADALVTRLPDTPLGIYVADCCALFAVDTKNHILGLAHAGKKGTEKGMARALLEKMCALAGAEADPGRITVQLSPCIRPPVYEVDFAADLVEQCLACHVPPEQVDDCRICTHSDPDRYYSYRRDKGRTGRMLAFISRTG